MKETFPHALAFVLKSEGKLSDDPNDSGGLTNFGVTNSEYQVYLKSKGEAARSVRYISQAQVADIYRTRYWDAVHGDELPAPVDLIVFDAAVNMGVGTAVRMLCLTTGLPPHLTVDPQLLERTIKRAATGAGVKALDLEFCQRRIALYHVIVARHPKDSVFLKGWLNRVSAVLIEAQQVEAWEATHPVTVAAAGKPS